MAHVSKTPLDSKQEADLFMQLAKLFANKNLDETQKLFADLLGTEEQIMLAKRLAIVAMLSTGQTIYFIANTLHVSSSTVKRIHFLMEDGKYLSLAKIFKNKKSFDLLQAIDDILHLGGILPHYGQTHKSEEYKKHMRNQRKSR